jgi:2-aminoadipate transaminase
MATLGQRLAGAFLATTDFGERVAHLQAQYRIRRDAMLRALEKFLPWARWVKPAAGFFIWVELPPEIGSRELLRSMAVDSRVVFVPGNEFWVDIQSNKPCHTLRLSFSACSPEEIWEGISRIAATRAPASQSHRAELPLGRRAFRLARLCRILDGSLQRFVVSLRPISAAFLRD